MEDAPTSTDSRRLHPWERQPGEGETQYAYFAKYRDLGPSRTVAAVAKEVDRSRDYLWKICHQRQWVRRVEQWDRWNDRLFAQKIAERRVRLVEQTLSVISVARSKLIQRLQTMDADSLTPTQWIQWFDVLWKAEREALGLPGHVVGHSSKDGGPVEAVVTELSDEERQTFFARLIAEAKSRAGIGAAGKDEDSMENEDGGTDDVRLDGAVAVDVDPPAAAGGDGDGTPGPAADAGSGLVQPDVGPAGSGGYEGGAGA